MLKYVLLGLIACAATVQADEILISSTTQMNNVTVTMPLLGDDQTYYRYSRPVRSGGFYVKGVNSARIRCADGKTRPECYVADVAINENGQYAGLSEETQATLLDAFKQQQGLIYGKLSNQPINQTDAPFLTITDFWESGTDKTNPPGAATRYYLAKDNGTRCITTPCYSVDIIPLNDAKARKGQISELDLSTSGATQEQQDRAFTEMAGNGLVVAGYERAARGDSSERGKGSDKGQKDKGRQLVAETFYWLATDETQNGFAACTKEYMPVCGANGRTYGNLCELNYARVELAYEGECTQQACTMDYTPVCGKDGKTYSNLCTLNNAKVDFDYQGECSNTVFCPTVYTPVCGVNGKTYGNSCELSREGVALSHDGECNSKDDNRGKNNGKGRGKP